MRIAIILLFLLSIGCSSDAPTDNDVSQNETEKNQTELVCEDPVDVYNRTVDVHFDDDRPNSCFECHQSSISLSLYKRDDPCATLACMKTQGLVDLNAPEESQVLAFISKGFETDKPAEAVQAEYDDFLDWITFSATCEDCSDIENPCGDLVVDPDPPECTAFCEPAPELTADNYGCDDSELDRAFYDHIFVDHGRCEHCHSPTGALADLGDSENWLAPAPTLYGAGQTRRALEALEAFDFENPEQTDVLLKPLHEIYGGIEHGGSKYAGTEDDLFVAFLNWINHKKSCDEPQ